MGLNQLTGTPWHIDKFTRAEGDNRRHRARCTHYSNRGNSYCCLYGERCHGTAHCVYYEEKEQEVEEKTEVKIQQDPQPMIKKNIESETSKDFPVGCKVRHVKYGKGRVVNVSGDTLTVSFYEHGKKNLKASVCKAGNLLVRRPD